MSEDKNKKQKWTKKGKIKAIVTFVIIALLVISAFIFVNKNNADAQLKHFSDSVENSDAKTLANLLSTNDRTMTTDEAEHFITYLKSDENPNRLKETLDNVKSSLKDENSTSDLGTLKDKNNKPVLSFSKNGKQMFLLDKISIKPHYKDVYIKELDNTATYDFDKKHRVAVRKNKVSKLGSFVVGNYEVPVKKVFKDGSVQGKVDGKIHINTDELQKDNHVLAKQDFNQTKIKIKLHNDEKLESKNKKLLINGDIKSLEEDKIYGYFPNAQSFSVKAEGKLKDNNFETNKVDVLQGTTNNSTQVVNLHFDDKEINKTLEEDKKIKKELDKFIKSYMEDLNKAYKNKEYNEISNYIEDDSSAEKFMEPKFEHKESIKYTDTKVQKVKKEGSIYKVYAHKKYKKFDVNNIYHVKIENDKPKIVKIEDA